MSKEPPKPIVDENGQVLGGSEAEQHAVNATSRIEEKQIGKDLELSRKGPLQNGRQNRGASLSAKIRDTQKEKDKKEKELRSAISEAQKALEASLAELTAELGEIDEGLNAITKLRALRESGNFDKDNADHILFMQQAGITAQEMESPEGGKILDVREKEFHKRREEVIKKSKVLIQEAEQNGYTSEAITEYKVKLEQTDSAVAYDAAVNHSAPEELKDVAGTVFTQNEKDLGVLGNERSFFGAGISVAKDSGVGKGITSQSNDLNLEAAFTKAADPESSGEVREVAVKLNLDGPKIT